MAHTVRRLESSVQKLALMANLSASEAALATDIVVGITTTGSCHLSAIARVRGPHDEPLIQMERQLSEGLAEEESAIDELRYAWLATAAGIGRTQPFLFVDGRHASQPHRRALEVLAPISDRPDKHRRGG